MGCRERKDDKNAYTWDVSAIIKEAGLDELLLDKCDKVVHDSLINRSHCI
jgi:hypothetical protein